MTIKGFPQKTSICTGHEALTFWLMSNTQTKRNILISFNFDMYKDKMVEYCIPSMVSRAILIEH